MRVNGRPAALPAGAQTWADVLKSLDHRLAAEGQVVTAVRFEGVDQPSFRDEALGRQPLDATVRIEVEALPHARLLRQVLGVATRSLPEIADAANRAADVLRRSDVDAGLQQLGAVLTAIGTLIEIALDASSAAGIDLRRLPMGESSAAGHLEWTGLVLDRLAQHQAVRDWPALADDIDATLAPAILHWALVFDAVQEQALSPGDLT